MYSAYSDLYLWIAVSDLFGRTYALGLGLVLTQWISLLQRKFENTLSNVIMFLISIGFNYKNDILKKYFC